MALTVCHGSFPGRRAAANPQPSLYASAAPRMNPRASAPRITSGSRGSIHSARRSTVSRKHAVLMRRDGDFVIEDQGSLNGTFLNRKRIESGKLENGDEVQIGKYKLTFLEK